MQRLSSIQFLRFQFADTIIHNNVFIVSIFKFIKHLSAFLLMLSQTHYKRNLQGWQANSAACPLLEKNMLTSALNWNNNGLTKQIAVIRPRKSGEFFMPILWRMRTENILNIGQRLFALVESAAYSKLSDITKQIGVKMNNIVKFNDEEVALINRNNQLYMSGEQISHLLTQNDKLSVCDVNVIYRRHKSEFEPDMTCLIRKGNTRIRIFNREGAWLIGMFARTPKAAEFRKWVLKVLGAVADNLSPVDKPVIVSEHTRALPSGKKEIVLSEKAKQEIGGIVKSVVSAVLECHPSHDAVHSCVKGSGLCETPNLFETPNTARDELKSLIREVIREEIADYNLKGGISQTEPHNNAPTANGLPIANWLVGISQAIGSINSIYEQMQNRQQSAVKLLTPSAKEAA